MDWYIEAGNAHAATEVRREVRRYLDRHAATGSAVDEAELVVGEVLANAIRHTLGPAWVSLSWAGEHPELVVYDLGTGFEWPRPSAAPATEAGGWGLVLVTTLVGQLAADKRPAGGTIVRATLPVRRQPSETYDPPRRSAHTLPRLEEARPDGGFGKEAFLRALVVQLAHTLETQHGTTAAEAAVAQVGVDVGGQMEREYRQAADVVGALDPQHLADCFVRLKHAIDGGFSILEATPERVVLVNDRCPFGDAVRASPSLCRMTSSVFGGIAARNSDNGASVILEERIAVGDPGCRVVVALTSNDPSPAAHHYGAAKPLEGRARLG
ncbi:MAG: methanogen output domain 1-containing protein [Acidimicrobiia bacterium]